MDLAGLANLIQTIGALATAITLIFLYRQVSVANAQRKLEYDKSGIEFVLNAEGQLDGIDEALIAGPPSVIRELSIEEIEPSWTDDEVKVFWYYRRYFGHVSRMIYLIRENPGEFGMSKDEGEELLSQWLTGLSLRLAHPIMRRVAENALKHRNYNKHMLEEVARLLSTASTKPVKPTA